MADGLIRLIEEDVVDGARLGRHVYHHPKNRDYPVRELFSAAELASQRWFRSVRPFDQGETSSCVGQGVCGLALTWPFSAQHPLEILAMIRPYDVYRLAQGYDPWAGAEPVYFGTSVVAGFQAARYCGYILKYRWAFGLDEALRTLSEVGPIVVGVNWYSSFDRPAPDGTIAISTGAYVRGGHAMEADEINVEERTVAGPQSWGPTWGDKGRWKMSWDTLGRLLDEDGEVATATLLAPGEAPAPIAPPAWAGTVAA